MVHGRRKKKRTLRRGEEHKRRQVGADTENYET